jgi:hypothetical protein
MQATDEIAHEKEQTGRLADLLACEKELAGLMARACDEARRRVDAARAEAERVATELDTSLAAEAERARREIDEGSRARVHATLADAEARAARFDRVSDAEVERLAASALRLLVGLEGRA